MPPAGAVLVVEDDTEVRAAILDALGDHGFSTAEAATGAMATELVEQFRPDVVVLDLGLPDVSGLDLLTELAEAQEVSIVVVSGRGGETDRVVGLDLGADDYLAKPFSTRELVARINAVIRRREREPGRGQLCYDGLTIDRETRDVTVGQRVVALTPKEYGVLAYLADSPRRVYTRTQILRDVWGSSPDWQDEATVGEHVHRIRRKLDPDNRERWIETIRGVGYRFAPPDDPGRADAP